MIPVTKTFLPPQEEYQKYLDQIWESGWVTNNGDLATSLEKKLEEYLNVPHLQLLSSGTMALQIALHTLDVKDEVITTPFSYVATTNAILWENCKPIFVDIEPRSLTIDPQKIEAAITENTTAILATHVYGIPCAVDQIANIAHKHSLKVIYDAAQAFGVNYKGQSLAKYGDLSAFSFHATKLFHTVEGGGLVAKNKNEADKIFLSKTFGHHYGEYKQVGINGKNSEIHAAMGHCILSKVDELIEKRKKISTIYFEHLQKDYLTFPEISSEVEYNYGYFPVIFESSDQCLSVKQSLENNEIYPRRYFWPSLNELPYLEGKKQCPISSDISSRILCLPIYKSLAYKDVKRISNIINAVFS